MAKSVEPGSLLRRYQSGEHEAVWSDMTALGAVDYLRIAFRWGGFPGWEGQQKRPEQELKFLTDGLLPI